MARTAKDGLSKHPTKGFRLTIGRKPDGKPRLFWLGHDRAIAEHYALLLRGHFTGMKLKENRDVWTDEDVKGVQFWLGHYKRSMAKAKQQQQLGLRALEEERQALEAEAREAEELYGAGVRDAADDAGDDGDDAATGAMLHDTMDRFSKWFDAKADRSPSSKTRLSEAMSVLKKAHKDIAMSAIDRIWLDSAIQYWKNRPPHSRTGKPLSTYTVKTVLQHMSAFFNWASDNDEVTGFVEPKKMAKLFKYRPEEIEEIEQLTFDEIKKLYAKGSDQQRLYLLCGITCGMTQIELAETTKDEFDFTHSIWKHRRHKTKVAGSHWLCPELVTLLKARIKSTPKNPDNLAFLTQDGQRLVTYGSGVKSSDAVKQSWDDLLEKKTGLAKGRRPTFKMCRKFLGQWMRDNYGEELAQVALQHKPQSVLSRHYAKRKNFDPLHDAQKALHAALVAAKVFDVATDEQADQQPQEKTAA